MTRLPSKDFRKYPSSSQYGSIQKVSVLFILAGCFIVLEVVLAWFALDRVEEKIQADVGEALQIVLETTQESLNLWVESYKFQLSQLAEDPRLISLTERQLRVPRNKNALLKSDTLRNYVFFFSTEKTSSARPDFSLSPRILSISHPYGMITSGLKI